MVSSDTRTGQQVHPYASYRFRVQVQGVDVAEFTECAGLEMTVKTDEVREGGQNGFVHRLPGRVEYGNLTLRRGYAMRNELFDWLVTSVGQRRTLVKQTVTVSLVDQSGGTVMSWTFLDAFPVKWSGPSFKAGDNAIALESLELAHNGMQQVRMRM
jgi:phage tail-like protein